MSGYRNFLVRGGVALGLILGVTTAVPALATPTDVTVQSEIGWQPAGLDLLAGQSFTVEYRSGTWTVGYGGLAWVGIEGYTTAADQEIFQGCKVLAGQTYGHLLARVGDSAPFVIDRGAPFTAPTAGRLELRINDIDRCLGDNRGAIVVRIDGNAAGGGPAEPTSPARPTNPPAEPTNPARPTNPPVGPTNPPVGPANPGVPANGMTLYAADWSSGLNGWGSDSSWKTLRGGLLNDGTNDDSTIFGPYQTGTVADYAVEARIRVISGDLFGIVIRNSADEDGYSAFVGGDGTSLGAGYARWHRNGLVDGQAFSPGTDWHTYRLEADGNVLRFLIDGALYATATDNRFLAGGSAGLHSQNTQLEVSGFTVLRLR